jgi:hypothetical protein
VGVVVTPKDFHRDMNARFKEKTIITFDTKENLRIRKTKKM